MSKLAAQCFFVSLLILCFDREDGGCILIRNISKSLSDYMVSNSSPVMWVRHINVSKQHIASIFTAHTNGGNMFLKQFGRNLLDYAVLAQKNTMWNRHNDWSTFLLVLTTKSSTREEPDSNSETITVRILNSSEHKDYN